MALLAALALLMTAACAAEPPPDAVPSLYDRALSGDRAPDAAMSGRTPARVGALTSSLGQRGRAGTPGGPTEHVGLPDDGDGPATSTTTNDEPTQSHTVTLTVTISSG